MTGRVVPDVRGVSVGVSARKRQGLPPEGARPRRARAAVPVALVGLAVAGCGGEADPTSDPASAPTSEPSETPTTHAGNTRSDQMNIDITIGEQRFRARLSDSAAARDLVDLLPVTIDMVDHGGVEKTGPLPAALSLEGQPEGADPDIGDLGYYAPGRDLVLYYGDQGYFPGIVVLGRLDESAPQHLAALDGSVRATVEVSGE
jgi:hypothetical protein